MTKRAGRSVVQRSGAAGRCSGAKAEGHLLRRQVLGLSRARGAGLHQRGEPRVDPPDASRRREAAGKEVLIDCEHFFDGYKANPAYALACAEAAYEAGARWVVLCDTNGGTLPGGGRRDRPRRDEDACPAAISASMPITTPTRRWPIRWPRSMPACARSRARSTASASAAAMPISSRSSRRWC